MGFKVGETKVAKVMMKNPTPKDLSYSAKLWLGTPEVTRAEVTFSIPAMGEKEIDFSVLMPASAGIYPLFLSISSDSQEIGTYQAEEDVTVVNWEEIAVVEPKQVYKEIGIKMPQYIPSPLPKVLGGKIPFVPAGQSDCWIELDLFLPCPLTFNGPLYQLNSYELTWLMYGGQIPAEVYLSWAASGAVPTAPTLAYLRGYTNIEPPRIAKQPSEKSLITYEVGIEIPQEAMPKLEIPDLIYQRTGYGSIGGKVGQFYAPDIEKIPQFKSPAWLQSLIGGAGPYGTTITGLYQASDGHIILLLSNGTTYDVGYYFIAPIWGTPLDSPDGIYHTKGAMGFSSKGELIRVPLSTRYYIRTLLGIREVSLPPGTYPLNMMMYVVDVAPLAGGAPSEVLYLDFGTIGNLHVT